MQGYFRLPNSIFDVKDKLKPAEFIVLAYLHSVEQASNISKKVFIRQRTIAAGTGLSVLTVCRTLRKLQGRSLLKIEETPI